ncbi:MAG: hypothetical protein U0P81_07175 [Holophagaceae bacterium]
MVPIVLPALLLSACPVERPVREVPFSVVLACPGPVHTTKFPLSLECTFHVKELDSASRPVVMSWKGTWAGPERPLFHVFDQGIRIPAPTKTGGTAAQPPVIEAVPVTLILKDAEGKVLLRTSESKEGPVGEVKPATKGLSFKVTLNWETTGRMKVDMSLEPVE